MPEPPRASSRTSSAPGQIVGLVALAWVPLWALALPAWVRTGQVDPLLVDAEVHARLLVALTVLLVAGEALEQRIALVLRSVADDGVLPDDGPMTDWLVAGHRLRAPALVKLLGAAWVAAVYTVPLLAYQRVMPTSTFRWLASTVDGPELSGSGAWWWYVLVGQPLLLLAAGRWLLRWWLWSVSMWRVARRRPRIHAAHADEAGGLGFLRLPLMGLRGFVFAVGITIAAVWFDEIGAGLAQTSTFAADFVAFLFAVLVLQYGPYVGFSSALIDARERGAVEYATLARRYLAQFDARWLHDPRSSAALLGNPDMSALADLSASVAVVGRMRTSIPTLGDLEATLIVAAIPFVVVALAYGPSTVELIQTALHLI